MTWNFFVKFLGNVYPNVIFRTDQLWTFHYRLVNNLNSVITYVDDSEGEDMDKQYIKGQALALRGWAYFDLARLYQQTYAIAKDMPGVPIYTEPTVDGTQGKPRGTLEETYQQILIDLRQNTLYNRLVKHVRIAGTTNKALQHRFGSRQV